MTEHHGFTPEFQQPYFREIEPIVQWSAYINPDVPYDEFILTTLATTAETRHRYAGTLTRDPATGNVTSFTHTRFRRNKYGPPLEIKDCEAGMRELAARFQVTAEREDCPSGLSRIVLGLYEGQHDTGTRDEPDGTDYSLDDIAAWLGKGFAVQPGEVFVTRLHLDGGTSHYSEEIAEIVFPTEAKQRVYRLGDIMKQERFSVEDFDEQGGQSYMVETRYCKEPDPVQPVET